jgi:hypothetical protein
MVARQRFARLELDLKTAAVLAAVAVAREQERVRHLASETTGHVNEARETDHRWTRERQPLGTNDTIEISFYDFSLSVDDQPQCTAQWDHRQWLERSIQCQTTNDQALLLGKPTKIYRRCTTSNATTPAVAGNSFYPAKRSFGEPLTTVADRWFR